MLAIGSLLWSMGASSGVAATALHVGHPAGVSFLDFDGSAYTAGGFISIPAGVNEVFVDSSEVIHAGHGQGISALSYTGTAYVDASPLAPFFSLPAGVAGIGEDSGGELHVAHGGGLSGFSFSSSTGYADTSAYIGPLPGLPGVGDVFVDTSDVIHAGDQNGPSAISFSLPGSYSAIADIYAPNVNGIDADSNGVLFVSHLGTMDGPGGLSALTFDGVGYTPDEFLALVGGGSAVAVDAGDIIHVADDNGISAVQFNPGAAYTSLDFLAFPSGINTIEIDDNGFIHAGHGQGVSALTFDGSSYTDTGAFIAITDVAAVASLVTATGGIAGDFDSDGDVDGDDFLLWQRNPGVGLLSDWQGSYGTGTVLAATTSVPEPASALLVILGVAILTSQRSTRS
ncbi:MAG: hypothetical protein CMJ72_15075 [Planctomycetaceae bacterium]|nr:hypothetical protein [Planctomycetaceae bacterium]